MCALWDHLNMHGSDFGVYTATEHNIPVLHTGSSIRDLIIFYQISKMLGVQKT